MAEAEQITSVSDDLAAAWDEYESSEEATEEVVQEEEPSGELQQEDTEADTAPDSELPVEEPADTPDSEPVQGSDGQGDGQEDADKPPVGLSATAREAWKDTPKAVRDEVAKREKDFAMGIQKYAENAQRANQMDQAMAPFQQYFALSGEPPAKTVQTLLSTASTLQMGTPAQKAQTVANLIQQFAVDVPALDHLLSGSDVPRETQEASQIERLLQEKLAPYEQHMAALQAQQAAAAQQGQQQIMSELQQFQSDPKNEFYNDVRGDMADILDMAGKRGQNMTLDEAYRRACMLHPEVSKIMETRNLAPTPQQKRAASSIKGSSGGSTTEQVGDSVQDALNAAWDAAMRTSNI